MSVTANNVILELKTDNFLATIYRGHCNYEF